MKRARLGFLVAATLPCLALVASGAASGCGSERALSAAGADCDLATDCLPGLVCVEQPNGRRVCSNDLTSVAGELPPDGAAPTGDDAGEGAAPGEDEDGSAPAPPPPPRDSGVTDTGSPPPVDASAD